MITLQVNIYFTIKILFIKHKLPVKHLFISKQNKEIKNASKCIVELYKHAGIFKNMREVHREARGAAECFSHISSVLKNSQVLILFNNA